MLSSSLWSMLPNELIELIFSQLVDAHIHTDPAYTWVCLRQLSAHQKHTIELRFRSFWLSKISITLYAGTRHKFEYVIDDVTGAANPDEGGRVIFSVGRQIHSPLFGVNQDSRPGRVTNRYLREAWDLYDPAANRNITVRLGEGYLARGCKGGYLLNDTHLPRLQVSRAGKIRFLWKEAVNELLREEMYMRKAGDDLFIDACNEWRAQNHGGQLLPVVGGGPRPPPVSIQVKLWRLHVQAARRVAALKHRVAKSQTGDSGRPLSLNFAGPSARLHRHPVPGWDHQDWVQAGADARRQTPDIFEIVDVEESAVPKLAIFQSWSQQRSNDDVSTGTICDLYRDEHAWRCWISTHENGEEEEEDEDMEPFWDTRRGSSREGTNHLDSILAAENKMRWMLSPW